MARQSLKLREAAVVLQELDGGKHSIGEIADLLMERGIIQTDADSIRQWECEQARKIIQKVRRFDNLTDTGKVELLHLHEYTEENRREEYYRKIEDCRLVGEADQVLEYWENGSRGCDRRWHYYYQVFCGMFGVAAVQGRLKYRVPENPDGDVQAG